MSKSFFGRRRPVSDDPMVAQAARAAAKELAPQYGARIEAEVEAALYNAGEATPPPQFFDPVAVGSLIVAVAALGWQMYRDLKKPSKDAIATRLRVEWRKEHQLTADAEKVIEIVSAEIVESAPDEG
jgi:hypothetical protein